MSQWWEHQAASGKALTKGSKGKWDPFASVRQPLAHERSWGTAWNERVQPLAHERSWGSAWEESWPLAAERSVGYSKGSRVPPLARERSRGPSRKGDDADPWGSYQVFAPAPPAPKGKGFGSNKGKHVPEERQTGTYFHSYEAGKGKGMQ